MNYPSAKNLDSTPFNIIGIENADLGKLEIAIRYFTEAIDLNPDDPRAYFNRATLLVKTGDIQRARSDFIRAQELSS